MKELRLLQVVPSLESGGVEQGTIDVANYIVEKGSITVDGISLTVNGASRGSFHVTMIPHTADVTTLGSKSLGSPVNIETDIIGKYVAKQLGGQKGSE